MPPPLTAATAFPALRPVLAISSPPFATSTSGGRRHTGNGIFECRSARISGLASRASTIHTSACIRKTCSNILDWTRQHMGNRPGACVPETMRFNGRGYENETWISHAPLNCAEDSPPYYNARTISTGAEVGLWVWERYEYTDDLGFLKKNYPLMREAARFLLAYSTAGQDGKLHTFPANAHEMQWDVHDPTTDVSAMQALFPRVVQAATLLKTDSALVVELQNAIAKLPLFRSRPLPLLPFCSRRAVTTRTQ